MPYPQPTPPGTPEQLSDLLGSYRPEHLTDTEWAVARGPVVAAVAGCVGESDRDAHQLINAVALLLAHATWDRARPPDLRALLTWDRVEAFARVAPTRSRQHLRTCLRRVAAHLAGADPAGVTTPRPKVVFSKSGAAFLAAAAHLGPVVALDSARWALQGRGLHGSMLAGAPDLRDRAANLTALGTAGGGAAGRRTGTFRAASRSARALADVTGVMPREVSPISSSPSAPRPTNPPAAAGPAKRPSFAAVRRARAEKARAARATSPAEPGRPAPLPEPVEAALIAWNPHGMDPAVWAACADVTRDLVRGYHPKKTGSTLRNPASILSRYAAWVLATRTGGGSHPVTLDEARAEGAADAYLRHLTSSGRPAATVATVRSELRRALAGAGGRPRPTPLAYRPGPRPMTPQECATLVRLCRNQPTAAKRRALSAMVALGLGAGLDAGDQRGVTPAHIHRIDLGQRAVTVVDVVGDRPRRVVVADEYADLLAEAVALHDRARRGAQTPLHGVELTRRCVVTPVVDAAVTATRDPVKLSLPRLRATWLLAAMCAPVPLADLMRAAGVRSARPFTDLLAHCPDPGPDAVAAVLAALTTGGGL